MATKINPAAAVLNDIAAVSGTALNTDPGIYINYQGHVDTRIGILLNNSGSGAATVTVYKGDGLGGVVDLQVSAPTGLSVIALDSSNFVLTTGEYKGHVRISGAATVTAAPVALP